MRFVPTQKNKGFSLVEVIVAIAVLMLALVAPLTIAARGIHAGYYSRAKTTAQFLAQEGVEAFVAARNDQVINSLDNGTTYGWTWIPSACTSASGCNIMFNDATGATSPMSTAVTCTTPTTNCRLYLNTSAPRDKYVLPGYGGTQSPFSRVIKLTPHTSSKGDTYYDVTSTVYWDTTLFGSGNTQSITLHSELYHLY